MKRAVSTLMVIMVIGAYFGVASPAGAQADGHAICATAQAQGSYGRYNVVLGSDGADVLRGGTDNDLICGFGGADRLVGGSGNDILVGGDGADDLRGNSGNDELYFDNADIRVKGGSGSNRIIAAPTYTGVASFIFSPYQTSTPFCSVSVQYSGFPPFASIDADLYFRSASIDNTLLGSVDTNLDASGSGTVFGHFDAQKNNEEVRVLGPGIDTGWVLATC